MKSSFRKSLAPVAMMLGASGVADADITGRWNSFQDWEFRVTEMPDLDQGRGAGGGAFALPNDGTMYCGPSATMNVFLYAIHHGAPGLLEGWSAPVGYAPEDDNWFDWRAGPAGDDEFYNHGGMNIAELGARMATHPAAGTGVNGLYWGARRSFGPRFHVQGHLTSPSYTPTLNRVAQGGMQRAPVIVVVGYYHVLGQSLGYPIVTRTGGHVMTLIRARRIGMNCVAFCRDPADDLLPPEGPQTWISQDSFRDRAFTAVDGWVLYAQPGYPLHYRYMTAFLGPGTAPPGQVLLLDAYFTVRPRSAVARRALEGADGPVPALARVEPTTWSDASEVDEWILSPSGTQILDYAQFGAGAAVVMLTAPPVEDGPAQVWTVNQYTSESELVAEIPDATALVAGMPPDIWVQAGDTLHLVWLDPTEAEYPDGDPPGALLGAITLPGVPELVRFDDYNRRLVAIDMDDRVVHLVTPADPPVIVTRTLPEAFPAGASLVGDVEVLQDADGAFLASVDGSSTLVQLDLSEPVTVTATLEIEDPATVSDLSISDGRLFVAGEAQVREFERNVDGDWIEVESDFGETEVEDAFKVVRSQTNFDPMLHEGDGYDNIDPPDLVPGALVTTCPDLDGDGLVGLVDLMGLLSAWGPVSGPFIYHPADANLDFQIGFADLIEMLTRWGPCPEL